MSEKIVKIRSRKLEHYRKSTVRFIMSFLIIAIALIMLIPFIWMVSASFKMQKDVMAIPINWIPNYFYLENFKRVLYIGETATKNYHFFLAYYNSIKVSLVNTICSLLTASLAGYAFAKLRFRGKNILFIIYLMQMMVPSQLTLIPRFVIFSELGITKSHLPIILSSIISVSATFLMRQSFLAVSNELRESAMIEGAKEYRIWLQIMMPVVKPTVAALATVQFLNSWNSYLDPLVFLSNWRLFTLPIALNQFVGEEIAQYNLVMAASSLTVIPVFIVFLCGQKFFIKGLMVGAVKG